MNAGVIIVVLLAIGLGVLIWGRLNARRSPEPPRAAAPVEWPARARLVSLDGAPPHPLQGTVRIGRDSHSVGRQGLRLSAEVVSGLHCTLFEQAGGYLALDEGSTNGTYVNGVRLARETPHALQAGDVLEIAPAHLGGARFRYDGPEVQRPAPAVSGPGTLEVPRG